MHFNKQCDSGKQEPVMFRAEKVTFLQFIIYAMAVPLISQLALILVQNFTNYVGGLKSDKMK